VQRRARAARARANLQRVLVGDDERARGSIPLMHLPSHESENLVMGSSGYAFADEDPRMRVDALSSLFDPVTFRHFDALGVDQGRRCWEVGTGGVTAANWLAHHVGARGRVLATDIDISWASDQLDSAVEVQRHDITSDDITSEQFDLVHARTSCSISLLGSK
jgi:hypothetical protein